MIGTERRAGSDLGDRPVGLRTRRRQLEAQRRQKIAASIAGGVAFSSVLVAALVWLWSGGMVGRGPDQAAGSRTESTLLLAYAPSGIDQPAASLVLFGLVGDADASALLIPSGTTTDIPVHGPAGLGESVSFGGPQLLALATENLLGVRVDGVAVLDAQGFAQAAANLEPFELFLDDRVGVRQGDAIVTKFQAGKLRLDGSSLAEFLAIRGEGESEIAAVARQQKAWEAVLERSRETGRSMLVESVETSHIASNLPLSALQEFLEKLDRRRVAFSLLPVDPKQSLEGVETFEPRIQEIQRLIVQHFPGAAIAPDLESRIRVGILNGNGGVGVTEEAARLLIPGGYRVVYTENADNFEYNETLIVFYRTPDERVARDIQSRLGRGKLVFNTEIQDVVDILIVLGKDFPGSG